MRRKSLFRAAVLALVMASAAVAANAQVTGLFYKEVAKDGRIYVFNTPETVKLWEESGDMGKSITLIGRGENGETIVAENETAMDLYLFRHNLDAYDRPTPKAATPAAYPSSKFGIRIYADASSRETKDKGTGIKSGDSGVGVDVKRTYFTFTHEFDAKWSALFQSDIGDQGARRFDVFVKKAFVQYKLNPNASFRLGAADTAWIPFVEGIYGFRYLEQTITDRLSFGASADWGLHYVGKAAGDKVNFQLSAQNGRGFSNPARSKTVDFEGRVSFVPVKGLTLALGGYSGKRGLETDAAPAKHTATRSDLLVNYANDKFKLGGEWFQADNWNTVTAATKDKSDGYSVWGSFSPTAAITVFGKFEEAKPSKDLKPLLKENYYNLGVQYRYNKSFAGALVYKYEEVKGGTVSSGNGGTVGSTRAGAKGTFNEIGIYTVYDF
ncbi:MAG TPA: carbohydrate porin [Thermoanaerobaculia bacterium]|nr:carbohydrate porin [Thermoanaerobaculia bacterium]